MKMVLIWENQQNQKKAGKRISEMTYETPFGLNLKLTTPVRVIPDTLPFEYQTPKKPKKGFLSK